MLVRCEPVDSNDLWPRCGRTFDSERRWSMCPHPDLEDPQPTFADSLIAALAAGWTPLSNFPKPPPEIEHLDLPADLAEKLHDCLAAQSERKPGAWKESANSLSELIRHVRNQ